MMLCQTHGSLQCIKTAATATAAAAAATAAAAAARLASRSMLVVVLLLLCCSRCAGGGRLRCVSWHQGLQLPGSIQVGCCLPDIALTGGSAREVSCRPGADRAQHGTARHSMAVVTAGCGGCTVSELWACATSTQCACVTAAATAASPTERQGSVPLFGDAGKSFMQDSCSHRAASEPLALPLATVTCPVAVGAVSIGEEIVGLDRP
jgi:hypothetical protein